MFEANPSSNVSSSINEGALYADGSLSVNIFYGSGSYTKIYEKPAVEIKDLIPDLGGRLGLFLGISILTFIEVFEVIYEICYAIVRKCYIVFFVGKEIKSNWEWRRVFFSFSNSSVKFLNKLKRTHSLIFKNHHFNFNNKFNQRLSISRTQHRLIINYKLSTIFKFGFFLVFLKCACL